MKSSCETRVERISCSFQLKRVKGIRSHMLPTLKTWGFFSTKILASAFSQVDGWISESGQARTNFRALLFMFYFASRICWMCPVSFLFSLFLILPINHSPSLSLPVDSNYPIITHNLWTNKPEKIASETRNFPGRIIVANMARDLKDWFLRSGRNLKIFPITIRNHQNLLCRKFNLKVVSAAHIRTNVIYWFLKVEEP